MKRTGGLAFALVCSLSGFTSRNSRAADADKAKESMLRQGVITGAGIVQTTGVGPAIMAGWLLELSLTQAIYLRGGPGLELLWNNHETTLPYIYGMQDLQNTSKHRILAIPLDAFLGLEIAHTLAVELGGTIGLAHSTLRSTVCGDRIDVRGYVGLEGGLSLRVGAQGQYLASLHAVASTLPVVTCVNSGINPDTGTMPAPLTKFDEGFNALGAMFRMGALF